MSTSLDEFKKVLSEVGATSKAALAGITALPLVSLAMDLTPPWPRGVAIATCLVELVVLMLTFHHVRHAKLKIINRTLTASFAGLIIASLIYFVLMSLVVFEGPNGDKFVKGFVCTNDALKIYGDACPFLPKSLIKEANFDADRLWTQLSLMGVRLALLVLWSAAFMFLSSLTGCFVVYHISQKSREIGAQ